MALETDTTEKVSPYSKYESQTIQLTVIDNEVEKRFIIQIFTFKCRATIINEL